MTEQHRLLPRFYRYSEELERQARIARILLEVGADETPSKPAPRSTPGGDPLRLRGLPAIARGVAGALPGSDPVRELLRAESRRERRLH